jgi:hypothetical protein
VLWALLLHGTLRPTDLVARPYYRHRRRRKAAAGAWTLSDAEQPARLDEGIEAA